MLKASDILTLDSTPYHSPGNWWNGNNTTSCVTVHQSRRSDDWPNSCTKIRSTTGAQYQVYIWPIWSIGYSKPIRLRFKTFISFGWPRGRSEPWAAEDIEPDEDELAADDVSQETVVATPAEDDDEVSLNAGQMLSSWIPSYSKNTYEVTGPSKRNVMVRESVLEVQVWQTLHQCVFLASTVGH